MMDTMVRADTGRMNERRVRDYRGGDMQSGGLEISDEDIAMAKENRHRLPSGFGTVRFLGKGRRRPFAVHPPAVAMEIEEILTNTMNTGKWAAEVAEFGERQSGAADLEERQAGAAVSSKIQSGAAISRVIQPEAEVSSEMQVVTEGGERSPASEAVISETAVSGAVVYEKSSPGLCDPVASGYSGDNAAGRSPEVRRRRIWKRPPAICYVTSRVIGRKILQLYHAGEYRKGMEIEIERQEARGQASGEKTAAREQSRGQAPEEKTAVRDQAREQQESMTKGMLVKGIVSEKAALTTEICEATSSKIILQTGPGKAEAGIGLGMAEAGTGAAKGRSRYQGRKG